MKKKNSDYKSLTEIFCWKGDCHCDSYIVDGEGWPQAASYCMFCQCCKAWIYNVRQKSSKVYISSFSLYFSRYVHQQWPLAASLLQLHSFWKSVFVSAESYFKNNLFTINLDNLTQCWDWPTVFCNYFPLIGTEFHSRTFAFSVWSNVCDWITGTPPRLLKGF